MNFVLISVWEKFSGIFWSNTALYWLDWLISVGVTVLCSFLVDFTHISSLVTQSHEAGQKLHTVLYSGVGAVFVLWFSGPAPPSFHRPLTIPARRGRHPKTQGQRDVWRWALRVSNNGHSQWLVLFQVQWCLVPAPHSGETECCQHRLILPHCGQDRCADNP